MKHILSKLDRHPEMSNSGNWCPRHKSCLFTMVAQITLIELTGGGSPNKVTKRILVMVICHHSE